MWHIRKQKELLKVMSYRSAWMRAVAPFLVLALGGCAVGPKYQRPVVETPEQWRWKKKQLTDSAEPGSASTETVELQSDWWTLFGDEKLSELVASARNANQDIKLAVARVDEARALARVKKADFFPEITLNPGYARQKDSDNTVFNSGNFNPREADAYHRFSLPIQLSYEIDVWGRVRRADAAARNRAESSIADYQAVMLTVSSDVALNYFLVRALDAELDVLQRTLKLREESLKLVDSRFKFGAADALELARAKSDLASTSASIADVKRQREEVVNILALLSGKPAPDFALETKPLSGLPPEVPMGLPSALLQRRPDILRAERTLAASNEEIGVAKAAFFPRISLTASSGFESQELTSLVDGKSAIWNLAGNLLQPLFNGGRNRAELEAAKARYAQSLATYQQQVLVAFKDVEDALVAIRFRAEQAEALAAAATLAREVTALATTRYERGQVSSFEVIDAQRQQVALEQQAAQVLGQRLVATVRLVKALGGGWKAVEPKK